MSGDPEAILGYWLGADWRRAPTPDDLQQRWFAGGPTTDAEIAARFGGDVAWALAGRYDAWAEAADTALALILLCDQFTRNLFRRTAKAFAGDATAQRVALGLVAAGDDQALPMHARWFVYMPLMHAEDAVLQDRSLQCFRALAADQGGADSGLKYAEGHRQQILDFGRFPHRNGVLGRTSTRAERAFLAAHGERYGQG